MPLRDVVHHLRALDPALSGPVLLPAEVDDTTGMPAYAWLQRAHAEAAALATTPLHDAATVDRVRRRDPGLAARLQGRHRLREHLVADRLLPAARIAARVRRVTEKTDVTVTYDRVEPLGTWLRIRVELSAQRGAREVGPVRIHGERARADDALLHLLTRHHAVPLQALFIQLRRVFSAAMPRLSRSRVGPFWFPGVRLPGGVPPELASGALLHLSTEVLGVDVLGSSSHDPMLELELAEIPDGRGLFRQRSFAATDRVAAAVRAWCAARRVPAIVVPLRPGAGPR